MEKIGPSSYHSFGLNTQSERSESETMVKFNTRMSMAMFKNPSYTYENFISSPITLYSGSFTTSYQLLDNLNLTYLLSSAQSFMRMFHMFRVDCDIIVQVNSNWTNVGYGSVIWLTKHPTGLCPYDMTNDDNRLHLFYALPEDRKVSFLGGDSEMMILHVPWCNAQVGAMQRRKTTSLIGALPDVAMYAMPTVYMMNLVPFQAPAEGTVDLVIKVWAKGRFVGGAPTSSDSAGAQ